MYSFDNIDHTALMDRVRRRIGDKRVLNLVKAFLKAGILGEDGFLRNTSTGTPQGGLCEAEHKPPCGVPRSRSCRVPSGSASGATSHRLTYSTTHGRSVFASTAFTIRSHGTESKNFRMSKSITQLLLQHRVRQAPTASSADRFGR